MLGMNEQYKQETGESVDWRRRGGVKLSSLGV